MSCLMTLELCSDGPIESAECETAQRKAEAEGQLNARKRKWLMQDAIAPHKGFERPPLAAGLVGAL